MSADNKTQMLEIFNKYFASTAAIRNVFIDHFGDDNVDSTIPEFESIPNYTSKDALISFLTNAYRQVDIVIRFPEVDITNERGNSVHAKNIFAKVSILVRYDRSAEDSLPVMNNSFTLSRSHFYKSHLLSDYMHSHCNGLPFIGSYANNSPWLSCCLGSGPIRRTISSLCTDYDLSIWELFCFELDAYVHTESLSGGPYRRMSAISTKQYSYNESINQYGTIFNFPISTRLKQVFDAFIKYLVRKTEIPFCYSNSGYMVAMPYLDFALLASNTFIEWFNKSNNPYRDYLTLESLYCEGAIKSYIIIENKINELRSTSGRNWSELYSIVGRRILTFKGNDITIEVEDDSEEQCTETTLLSSELISYIASLLVKTINYYYGDKFLTEDNLSSAISCKYKFI